MKRYIITVGLMLDELLSALLGGYANETISHRMAVDAQEGRWVGCVFCKIIDWLDPGHCDLQQPDKIDQYTRGGVTVSTIRKEAPGYSMSDGSGQNT